MNDYVFIINCIDFDRKVHLSVFALLLMFRPKNDPATGSKEYNVSTDYYDQGIVIIISSNGFQRKHVYHMSLLYAFFFFVSNNSFKFAKYCF